MPDLNVELLDKSFGGHDALLSSFVSVQCRSERAVTYQGRRP
jgi:hypothetical protein